MVGFKEDAAHIDSNQYLEVGWTHNWAPTHAVFHGTRFAQMPENDGLSQLEETPPWELWRLSKNTLSEPLAL